MTKLIVKNADWYIFQPIRRPNFVLNVVKALLFRSHEERTRHRRGSRAAPPLTLGFEAPN